MKKSINLSQDPVKKIFWTYAIPSILAMLAQTTAAMIDSIFIGRYVGPEGLSAITVFFPLLGILIGLGSMFAIGGTTLAGIEMGRKNHKSSNNYFNVTVFLLTVLSLIATACVILGLPFAIKLLKINEMTMAYINDYGSTISYFFLFFMLNFAFSFFLKLDGKPVFVVVVMVIGTLINVVLDYVFVVQFKMGLTGAALATGASQLIPWLILIFFILFKSNWQFKKPVFKWHDLKQIVFNGSSELLSQSAVSISGLMINFIIISKIGVIGLAGYSVALQVASIVTSIGYGFSESNQSAISFNYGANALNRVEQFRTYTLKTNIITGLFMCILTFFFSTSIASIFVKDPETIQYAGDILKYYSIAFAFMGANIGIGTYYTAINDPLYSGGITVYRSLISLISGLIILPVFFGNMGIWLSIIFAEVTTFLLGQHLLTKRPFGLQVKKVLLKNAS